MCCPFFFCGPERRKWPATWSPPRDATCRRPPKWRNRPFGSAATAGPIARSSPPVRPFSHQIQKTTMTRSTTMFTEVTRNESLCNPKKKSAAAEPRTRGAHRFELSIGKKKCIDRSVVSWKICWAAGRGTGGGGFLIWQGKPRAVRLHGTSRISEIPASTPQGSTSFSRCSPPPSAAAAAFFWLIRYS